MIFYKKQIIRIFTDLENLKIDGIWYSGIKKEGEHKIWWENGKLHINTNYKNGVEDGKRRKWYFNGQLHIETNYKNGDENGEYKEWHKNGQLYIDAKYSNGKEIYYYKYDKNGNKL